jgi:peptidoglycan/xylan/chitin deacetylase (PgdA/CDA1 family)
MPGMEDRASELRARRAGKARALRRRRRAAACVFAAALALTVAGLVVSSRSGSMSATRAGVARTTPRSVVGSLAPYAALRPPGALRPSAGGAAPSAAQLAAVERLARYGLPLFCGGRSKRVVALTFDDGPGPYTHFAVRKLRENHLRATFFLVGKQIRAYPGWARRETPVAAFGDHTLTHPFLPALGQAEMVEEIAGDKTLVEHATRERVVLFRPPYEGRTPAIDHEAKALGMLEVLWNVDSADSLGADYAGIEQNVLAGLHPGSVILMHENRGQTIRALPTIFRALDEDHLRAVTIPELVEEDPPSLAQLRAGGRGCPVYEQTGNGS